VDFIQTKQEITIATIKHKQAVVYRPTGYLKALRVNSQRPAYTASRVAQYFMVSQHRGTIYIIVTILTLFPVAPAHGKAVLGWGAGGGRPPPATGGHMTTDSERA
jgi:hypothetical protein